MAPGTMDGAQQGEKRESADTDPRSLRLVLPHEDADQWAEIEAILQRELASLADLDAVLTEFAARTAQPQHSKFFSTVPGTIDAAKFDFDAFRVHGMPLMRGLALEMPALFRETEVPLLLDPRFTRDLALEQGPDEKTRRQSLQLTRRQVACLLAHSFFGSITEKARAVGKERWAFRVNQLFFLESLPAAFAFLNYWKVLGQRPELLEGAAGMLTYERLGFERKAGTSWAWERNARRLCPVAFALTVGERMEESPALLHVDFANRFVGGGCLENDKFQEEILFAMKPELIVAMALTTYLQDEEVVRVHGALQFSAYSGYGSTFEFEGDYCCEQEGAGVVAGEGAATPLVERAAPPAILAMDALYPAKMVQFSSKAIMLRDLNKARLGFAGFPSVATGNWGCGAFGNDHLLKFLQQWMAASDASVEKLHYHTYGDQRAEVVPRFWERLRALTVGELWEKVCNAAEGCAGPTGGVKFRRQLEELLDSLGDAR